MTSTCRVYAPRSKTSSSAAGSSADVISASARTSVGEVLLLFPGAHRRALDELVRPRALEPALDEREQQPLAEEEPVARLQVAAHPLGPDDEPLDEPREPVEHVVEREERVRDRDTLRRRVRDVALVPERDVLETDDRRRPHDARQPADPLGDDGVALVRHRRRPLLAAAERLLDLAHLRPCEMPDLERELLQRRRRHGERGEQLGMAVALEDLGRRRRRARARGARTRAARPPDRSPQYVPTAPESFPTRSRSSAAAHARLGPDRARRPRPASLRPNVVGSA